MSHISEDTLIRFINNSCSDEELEAVGVWLGESEENAERLFEAEQLATLAACEREDRYAESRLRESIRQRIARDEFRMRMQKRRRIFRWVSSVAAVLAVAVCVGFALFRTVGSPMVYVAATDESISVVLPDSTVVFLNKNSGLAYPEAFASNRREVELDGEGYFEVTHDSARPFVVIGRYMSVEVHGTMFNFVSRDSADNSVSLLEGSVEVMTDNQAEGVVLEPGQKAIYKVESGRLSVQDTNVAIDAVWHDRLIPFENANMTEIVEILDRLYDVEIELDGSVDLTKTYSGVTVYCGSIDTTLARLAYTLPIRFVEDGGHIVICAK